MTSQYNDSDASWFGSADMEGYQGFEIPFGPDQDDGNDLSSWINHTKGTEPGSDFNGFVSYDDHTSEAQGNVNGVSLSPKRNTSESIPKPPSSGANRERKRQSVSNNLPKAKGKSTKKERRTVDVGQSSTSQQAGQDGKEEDLKELIEKTVDVGQSSTSQQAGQDGKEEDLKVLIEKKFVSKEIKILMDRIERRIKKEKVGEFESLKFCSSAAKRIGFSVDLNLIQSQCSVRSDLENIKNDLKEKRKEIKEMERSGILTMEVTEVMKKKLAEIGQKIKKTDEQQREDSREVKNLEKFFTAEGVNAETQREKLSSKFPGLFREEIATNMPTANQDQGSLSQLLVKDFKDFESRLFATDRMVEVSDFQGLPEVIEKTTGTGSNVPDCLKPVATRIEKARGKTTDFVHENIALLVCAAIQEMEYLPFKDLDERMLSRWGATMNNAKEFGFQVDFAESLFKKNLYAYYLRSKLG